MEFSVEQWRGMSFVVSLQAIAPLSCLQDFFFSICSLRWQQYGGSFDLTIPELFPDI